jgi:hypothetical protein
VLNSGCSSRTTIVLDSIQALIRAEIRDSCGFACSAELRIQRAVLPAPEALRLIDSPTISIQQASPCGAMWQDEQFGYASRTIAGNA